MIKPRNAWFLLVILMLCLSGISPAWAEPDDKEKESAKITSKIFLIIIDGLQGDVLQRTSAPNINGVITTGVQSIKVNTVYPDTIESAVASILTGMQPENHNFSSSDSKLKTRTIQDLLEERKVHTSFFGADKDLKNLMASGGYNCTGPFNNKDELVINNLLNEWTKGQSYFNIVLLPELRGVLTKYGPNSNEYKMAVTRTDAQVGRLLRKLHDEKTYDNSLIVVTGTTGAPPLILKGLPFKQNAQIPPVSICDIAPTIGHLNGIKFEKTDGLVLWNTFRENQDQDANFLMSERVKDLSTANYQLQEQLIKLHEEKLQIRKQQELFAKEKNAIQKQIELRDKTIDSYRNRISIYHIIAFAMIGVFLFGYFVFYKLLKKRFLMFN